jgi:hypothetical protein
MTSGTPLLIAAGASPTTRADEPATSSRLKAVLNSHATPRLVCSSSQRVTPNLNSDSAPISWQVESAAKVVRRVRRTHQVTEGRQ